MQQLNKARCINQLAKLEVRREILVGDDSATGFALASVHNMTSVLALDPRIV